MFLFSLLIWISISCLLFSCNYQQFIDLIRKTYPEAFDIDKISTFFTSGQFILLRIWSIFVISIHLMLFYFVRKNRSPLLVIQDGLIEEFNILFRKFIAQFRLKNTEEKIVLGSIFLLAIAHHIYLWIESPFRVDDIASYVFCAHQGPIVSGLSYHEVNNHIFFNIVCSLFDKLPISPEAAMILPSSLSWLLILTLVYGFARSEAGFRVACLALLLSGLLCSSANYSVQGRGYMMMSLFLLVSFFSVYKYSYREKRNIYLFLFSLSSFFATWILPSSLIAIIPLIIFLLIKSYSDRKNIIYTIFSWAFFVALVYIPILLINGPARFYNSSVKARGFSYYFGILKPAVLESIDSVVGLPCKGYLVLIGFLLLFCFLLYKKSILKSWLTFFSIIMIGSFIFITLRTSFPPYRTWTYVSFLFNISIAILLGAFIDLFFRKKLIFYFVLVILTSYCLYPHIRGRYIPTKAYAEAALKTSKKYSLSSGGTVLVDRKDILYYYIRLERIKRGNLFQVITEKKKNEICTIVIQYESSFPPGLEEKDYVFAERFDDCKIYRLK